MQDVGSWQDDHAEKDLEEIQRGSGQDAPACRCPLEQELLGRRPQWHGKGKAPVRFEATRGVDSPVAHHHTRAAALWYGRTSCREACRSAGSVPSAGAPCSQRQFKFRISRDREACWSAGTVPGAGAPQSQQQYNSSRRGREASGVLAQCPALAHLNLWNTDIRANGAARLAGVLAQCAALAHLNLGCNGIGAVGGRRMRASWRGQASGLLLWAPAVHLALLSLCHLFSREATRRSDILYTYNVVTFGLALSL